MLLIVTLLLTTSAFATQRSYDGYKVYQMELNDKLDCDAIKKFESSVHYDFFKNVNCKGYPVVVMVSPSGQKYFEDVLRQRNIQFKIQVENVQRAISEERDNNHTSYRQKGKGDITFDAYYGYEDVNEIYAYVESLSKTYPKNVELLETEKTYEGRKIPAVKISTGGSGKRPAIFIDAAHHAREWASIVPALHLIHQLVQNETYRYLTEKVDWIIVPVLNVDGYEYSRTTERLWRINRQKDSKGCDGTDLNRNYDILWESGIGTTDECSNIYKGVSPFSAPESSAIAKLVQTYKDQTKLYLSLHTFSNAILVPYAYSGNDNQDVPENDEEIRSLAKKVADAIYKYNGTRYSIGTPHEVLGYAASGGSYDWAKVRSGIDLAFVMELTDGYGFLFPENQLQYLVPEVFEAFKVFHHYVEKNYAV